MRLEDVVGVEIEDGRYSGITFKGERLDETTFASTVVVDRTPPTLVVAAPTGRVALPADPVLVGRRRFALHHRGRHVPRRRRDARRPIRPVVRIGERARQREEEGQRPEVTRERLRALVHLGWRALGVVGEAPRARYVELFAVVLRRDRSASSTAMPPPVTSASVSPAGAAPGVT